jgi:hypothetical protein
VRTVSSSAALAAAQACPAAVLTDEITLDTASDCAVSAACASRSVSSCGVMRVNFEKFFFFFFLL